MLAVVTHELEKIHNSFERLQYQTLVPCNCRECVENENPFAYALEDLRKRLSKSKFEIECGNSYEMVDVRKLIDDVNLSQIKNTPLQQQLESEKEKSFNQNQNTMNYNYQDFQILVDKNNNIRASSEQGDESGKLNLDMNEINLTLKLIESKQTNSGLLKGLDQKLYQALFPNDINAQFKATVAAAQENKHENVNISL